ncbi:tetratricopeptide repeat protein [Vulgatibacter sp.]|uniref:tetratricopeptide repeat protein n=1 Tax=Vulgatibacter sp. TaxID=1971226 RepID=UPI0035654E96
MENTTLPAPPRKVAPWLLAALAFALYLPSLGNGLTNWDDPRYVTANPIATQGFAGIAAAFTQTWDDAWYPLTHALYAVVQAVAGPSALAHHLVQALVFAASVALVPAALAAFGVPTALGFWAALLWAAHPLRVESVSWAANLKDALSALGVIAAVALHGAGRRKGSALAFAAALLAKSTVAPLAPIFVLLEAREVRLPAALRRALPWLAPAAIVLAIAAWLHVLEPAAPGRSQPGGGLLAAIPSALWLPWWYLGRILLPQPSQAIYTFDPVGLVDWRFAAALLLWGAALVLARRWRGGLTALAAWALPFAAVTGLVPLLFPVADRYALLSSLAVSALVILGAAALAKKPAARVAAAVVASVAVVALGAASIARQAQWRDSIALWEADVARDPSLVDARLNLAAAYGEGGRWDDVIVQARESLKLAPDRALALRHLFTAQATKAEVPARFVVPIADAIELADGDPVHLVAAAGRALRIGAHEAALTLAHAALRDGDRLDARLLLAQGATALAHHDDALEHAKAAAELAPTLGLPKVLHARALASQGRLEEAMAVVQPAEADEQVAEVAKALRASILLQLGRPEEAKALVPELPKIEQ